ncbi:hypothetical protein Lysil_0899 [Lysobacter silvestris]|uniref:Uncharacterized protein n=1 Tax=Solilutibacter silvestris TaxID=1645665 RepID=A0A2K1Q2I6_9GAMM|nr:hypothetical protein Lysil_0899 [Lysobacter silvestris]
MSQGLTTIERNANFRVGELDRVMHDGEMLVFVEVRYRTPGTFGDGADSIDWKKRQRLVRAAEAWLQRHPEHRDRSCRFDVVDAHGDPASPALRWIRSAFRADEI